MEQTHAGLKHYPHVDKTYMRYGTTRVKHGPECNSNLSDRAQEDGTRLFHVGHALWQFQGAQADALANVEI